MYTPREKIFPLLISEFGNVHHKLSFFFFLSCVGKANYIHITPILIHVLRHQVMDCYSLKLEISFILFSSCSGSRPELLRLSERYTLLLHMLWVDFKTDFFFDMAEWLRSSTYQLVKMNILSVIWLIREGVWKTSLMCKFMIQHFQGHVVIG